MFKILKGCGKIAAGGSLIILGIAGVILPIIPGIPFLLVGGALVSPKFRDKMGEYHIVLKNKLKDKFEQWKKKK